MMKKRVFFRFISSLLSAGMIVNLSTGYECLKLDATESNMNSKISQEVMDLIESHESEIPVFVWSKSVDDNIIENNIEKSIGFSINQIEENYTAPTQELINELKSASEGSPEKYLETLMKKHMDLTAGARAVELEKTNLYKETRRTIVSDLTLDSTQNIIEKANIDEESVVFKSQYAPMFVCTLSPEKINELSKLSEVEKIDLYEIPESVDCSFPNTNVKTVMGVNHINQYLNLTGSGVTIGFYESGTASSQYNLYDLDMNKVTVIGETCYPSSHATWTASISAGNYGIAPNADVISVSNQYDYENFYSTTYLLTRLEDLISEGVDLINVSWGFRRLSGNSNYDNWSKYFDSVIVSSKVTIVCSSGNYYDECILIPSSSYNTIAVNAFIRETNNTDVLCRYSYKNDYCSKPDVIAETFSDGYGGGYGTSTSAPVISGMIALLFQYKPSLTMRPEITKAILMASCHKKATKIYDSGSMTTYSNLNESMTEGLSLHQGAGIPDMYNMISIASQHSYGGGTLSNSSIEVGMVQPGYSADYMNVAMAYLQSNVTVDNNDDIPCNYDDCDLKLTAGNTTKTSTKANSSTELIYTYLFSSNNKYTLKIEKYSGNSTDIKYGYAWSTNNTKFIPTLQEEGIYYLRNVADNSFMTYNSSYSNCTLNSFSENNNQAWIMKYNSGSGNYTMKNASGSSYGMKKGSVISGSYYHVTDGTSSDAAAIGIRYNNDGTISFVQNINGSYWAIGKYQGYVAWSPWGTSDAQKWYIESLQWRRGDVNMDGVINSTDASIVQNHLNNYAPLTTNISKFLADADLNGIIDVTDINYINNGLC